MNDLPSSDLRPGRVASIHLHPAKPGEPMRAVDSVQLVADKGILGDLRYFERLSRTTGQPSLRQISLIERETIAGHALKLEMDSIPPGAVRSNFETEGIKLSSLRGREIEIGDALLLVNDDREPCEKMDAIKPGLRELMKNGCQGVMAQVLRSGRIKVGDVIYPRGNWDS